jgi:manganese transport protein
VAGQVIIEGFLGIRFGLFLRRLVTVVPAVLVIALGVDAFTILIVSQVALSIQLPFAIIPLVWLTSRREFMGRHVNRRATTMAAAVCGGIIVVLNGWLLGGLVLGG